MKYFDAHCHLQDLASTAALEEAMLAAKKAGVEGMLCCGTLPEDWGSVLEISGRYPGVVPCFGLHPWFSAEEGWLGKLEEFIRRAPGALVGETGLDGLRESPGQEDNFAAQLELAARFNRPAVLHCVKSWGRLLELLKKAGLPSFMLHAYGGAPELVKDFAALGGYFSFGGELADPARVKLREALAAVPQDRLLLESESPELRAAGPAGVVFAAEAAAIALGRPVEEVAALSLVNAKRFTGAL